MTTIVTKSGARKEIPANLKLERIAGLDPEGRIVVNDSAPSFLFGLTLCCNASDKGAADGIVCRGCYGMDGDLAVSRDGRKVIADTGDYLFPTPDGSYQGLDALDHFENVTEGAHA